MKEKFISVIASISFVTCITSCHKDQGLKDNSSDPKTVSIKIGNKILYAASNDPSNNIGSNGDLYLDLNNNVFYTGKTSQGWVNAVILKNSNNKSVSDQSPASVFIGKGTPAASVGKYGDFYIDTSNYILYGPKDTTNWNTNLLALTTSPNTESDFVITNGFDNIQLDTTWREYGTKYFYSFLSTSSFTFNQDDSLRRAKYKYYNYSRINFLYLGFPQIVARAMNVSVRTEDLILDPNIKSAKVGQPFEFIADSLHTSFTFTKEDSIRMMSNEYPDSILWRPLDPTMKVGEKMRFGVLTLKSDSMDIYDNTYSAYSSVALKDLIPTYASIKSVYQLYLFIKALPQYKIDSLSGTWIGGRWTNTTPYVETVGKINDSTSFYVYTYVLDDSLKISSTLYAYKNGGPYITPINGTGLNLPYAPSDTAYNPTTAGGRAKNYNADEYREGTFYQVKVVMVPQGHSINLSNTIPKQIVATKNKRLP